MKGHKIFLVTVLLLVLCLSVTSGFSFGKENLVIKVGLIDPPSHVDTLATQRFAELVAKKTGGNVKVKVYPAAQLGNAMDLLQGMKTGSIEMFVGAVTWLGAFETDYWIPGTLYVFNDQEQCRAVHQGAYFDKLAENMRIKHGIRVLTQDWDRGARNFIATKPIKDVDDLKGLKIRVPEQKSWIANFKLVGANPTPVALAETFTGLQMGVVTATEHALNWLYFNKYHTIAKNVTLSYHNYEETGVFISEMVYKKLSADDKKAVSESAKEVSKWHNAMVEQDIKSAKDQMAKEGVNFIEVDLKVWRKHFRSIFPELAKQVGYSKELVNYVMSQWK